MLDDQNELFIVVDKDDNVLGYRTRYDCHHDRYLIHRGIGIILFNGEGKILLQKRSMKKDLNPGMYSISVGGHVMKGQSYEEAAKRELKEELGIVASIRFTKKFLTCTDEETEIDALFTGIHNGPFFPAPDEIDMVQFFSKEEIKKMKDLINPFGQESLYQIGIL